MSVIALSFSLLRGSGRGWLRRAHASPDAALAS
jgi:hypothetical protein